MPQKKISYKFNPKNGGSVEFKGLAGDEEIPEQILDLLDKYGFENDLHYVFFDRTHPDKSCSVEENIENMTSYVSMWLCSTVTHKKSGVKVSYSCSFADEDTANGKNIHEAMAKAHVVWNKAGRPIDGVTITDKMDEALEVVNRKRNA